MFRKVRRLTKQYFTSVYNALFNREQGVVYMLHRVGEPPIGTLPSIADLYVSAERLEQVILQHSDCDFISLTELEERIRHPRKLARKYVAFTFDDGYRDNLTDALPVFEKYNIPFSVFVTSDFVERHPCFNFPFLLERIIRENDCLEIAGRRYACKTINEKEITFRQLKEYLLSLPYPDFEKKFKTLFSVYLEPEYVVDDTLTWEEIQQLAMHPLCTIGAHSRTHCRFTQKGVDLQEEIIHCKQIIEGKINQTIHYISYPFGWVTDVDEKVIGRTKSGGYAMGFISWGG